MWPHIWTLFGFCFCIYKLVHTSWYWFSIHTHNFRKTTQIKYQQSCQISEKKTNWGKRRCIHVISFGRFCSSSFGDFVIFTCKSVLRICNGPLCIDFNYCVDLFHKFFCGFEAIRFSALSNYFRLRTMTGMTTLDSRNNIPGKKSHSRSKQFSTKNVYFSIEKPLLQPIQTRIFHYANKFHWTQAAHSN